jgi:hypothetical protein
MRMQGHRGRLAGIATLALIAVIALAQSSTQSAAAAPATPVLEFVAPSFPVPFTAAGGAVTAALADFDTVVHCEGSEGSGELTGPRTALSHYIFTGCETQGGVDGGSNCKSAGAEPNEIRSGQIEAQLVFINQSTHQVGMLLAPHGEVYLTFECGGEEVKAIGPFLSPVGPINQTVPSFTASLKRSGTTQIPDHYEGPAGEALAAVPTGERGVEPPVSTGVELEFLIHTAVPIEVKALSSADVELARLNEELREEARKRHEEDLAREAAAKRQLEELTVTKRAQEELAQAQAKARQRAQHLTKAMRQCHKLKRGQRRARCESRAKKKFAPRNPIATASH